MGYLSYFQYEVLSNEVIVDNNKCNELEKFFRDDNHPNILGFYNVKIERDGERLVGIYPEETEAKFYDSELFISKFTECIKSGEILVQFIGEDGDIKAYIVRPNEYEVMYNVLIPASEYENLKKKCSERIYLRS